MTSTEYDVKKCQKAERYLMSKHLILKRFVIGTTALNRKIVAYTVGSGNGVLMCGAFHGMERLTAGILFHFLDDVCNKSYEDRDFARALYHTGLTVVPMVNPDGVEISVNGLKTARKYSELVSECILESECSSSKWQANARGVDINHNFDADFASVKMREKSMGITKAAPTRYGGEFPCSEKETKALCELCNFSDFKLAVALHTQGREIYYDFEDYTPLVSKPLAQQLSQMSGYTVSYPSGIAVGGGFKDWFIEKFGRPAFTLELGLGENPLPPQVVHTEYDVASKMLWHLLFYAQKNSDE